MSALEDAIQEMVNRAVTERIASLPRPSAKMDDQAAKQIAEYQIISQKPYLTKEEAALYLDCSERSIEEWSSRPVDKNPLPISRVGRDIRIRREKLDDWAEREGQRWRLREVS